VKPEADRRVLLYSHDGLGHGHVRRNLAIAAAIVEADPGAAVLVATSSDEVTGLGVPAGVDVLKLPGLRKVGNGRYASRHLRMAPAKVKGMRAALLQAAAESFRPSVLLADKHPLGVGGELRGALHALRVDGGRAALGLRDILDDRRRVRADWERHDIPHYIAELYDRVLVYGDAAVFDPVREYGLTPEVSAMTRFCGYVCGSDGDHAGPGFRAARGRPVVLASAGGGEDGYFLLRAFVDASAGMPWQAMVVAGAQTDPDERESLRLAAAEAGVAFRRFVPGLSSWLPDVDALVCMGGYNTLVEAMAAGVPTVCVPRIAPRQEQLIRAQAFRRLGLLQMIEPSQLEPLALRTKIARALGIERSVVRERVLAGLSMGGAGAAAAELLALHDRPRSAPAVAALA
jgi:predicted glycosyltransferase